MLYAGNFIDDWIDTCREFVNGVRLVVCVVLISGFLAGLLIGINNDFWKLFDKNILDVTNVF